MASSLYTSGKAAITKIIIAHFLLVVQHSGVQAFSTLNTPRLTPTRSTTSRQAFFDLNISDALQSFVSHSANTNIPHDDAISLPTVISTMYTATLPPLDPESTNAISTMKDYFIPTTSNDATVKALEGFAKSKQALSGGATLPNSSDLMQFDASMPGAKGLANPSIESVQKYAYNQKIDKRELEWIAQQFDIYMRKIPFAVTVYALLDFFVLSPGNGQEVLSDELEEDRMGVVMDWVSGAATRVGILAAIVFGIIFIENLTYHPV